MEQQSIAAIAGIISEVRSALTAKELEISSSSICIPYVTNAFKKCQREVVSFERSSPLIPAESAAVVNFQRSANEILGEISKIVV